MDKLKIKIKINESDFRNESDITKVKIALPMVNPMGIALKSELYTIESNPVTQKALVERKDDKIKSVIPVNGLVDLKYFAINRHRVSALSITEVDGKEYVVINGGEIKLQVSGSSERGTIENIYFTDFEDVKEVCRVATKVELDKIKHVLSEVKNVESFLQKQAESDTF